MKQLQERLKHQQGTQAKQRRQRIRELETKIRRCISEISWCFYPDGGFRAIDADAAEQVVAELCAALRELRRLDQQDDLPEGNSDGED